MERELKHEPVDQDPTAAWQEIAVEDPNRIGLLVQLRPDHANAALLTMLGDTVLASLDTSGNLRVLGKLVDADGIVYRPAA